MFLADLPGFKNPLFLNFKKSFFLAHPIYSMSKWPHCDLQYWSNGRSHHRHIDAFRWMWHCISLLLSSQFTSKLSVSHYNVQAVWNKR